MRGSARLDHYKRESGRCDVILLVNLLIILLKSIDSENSFRETYNYYRLGFFNSNEIDCKEIRNKISLLLWEGMNEREDGGYLLVFENVQRISKNKWEFLLHA